MSNPHPAEIAAESVKVRQRIKASVPPPQGERAKDRVKSPAKPDDAPATPARKGTTRKTAAKKATSKPAAKPAK